MLRACDRMRQGPVTQPRDRDTFRSIPTAQGSTGEVGILERMRQERDVGEGVGVWQSSLSPRHRAVSVGGQESSQASCRAWPRAPCCLPGVTRERKGLLENPPGAALC